MGGFKLDDALIETRGDDALIETQRNDIRMASTLLIHPKYLDWSLKAYADKCAFNLHKPTRKSQQALGVYLERTTMEVSNRSYATQLAAQTRRIVRETTELAAFTVTKVCKVPLEVCYDKQHVLR